MKESGVDCRIEGYENMIHVFQIINFLSEAKQATNSIANFIGEIFNDKRVENK